VKTTRSALIAVAILFLAGAAAAAQTVKLPSPKTLYTVMSVTWKDRSITVDVRYPQFNKPALDKLLKDKAMAGVGQFIKDAREYRDGDEEGGGEPRQYACFIDFTIRMLNSSLISLTYDTYVDYAGAHPTTMMSSVAADFKTGKPIKLDDIFKPNSKYLSTISKSATKSLLATLDPVEKDNIDSGAAPKPENFSVFYFQPSQIVFYFNEYQVASYAAGPQSYTLNLWETPGDTIVKPEFIKKLVSAYE
jgi:hypothetical protein